MPEGPWGREVAPTHRTTRRAAQQSFDGFWIDAANRGGVVEVDGWRLGWWRQRRRLRRRYGIVTSRVGESTWELRRERA